MKTQESPTNPHAAGKAAHSPLPWRVNGNHIEARPDPENSDTYWAEVAYLDTEWFERITEANAQFIVRACNSHAALVEALEAADLRITACATAFYVDGNRKALQSALEGWKVDAQQARAAIARATGQGGAK